MSKSLPAIIDGDGHVFENLGAMWDLMDEPYQNDARSRSQSMFPSDHLHTPWNKSRFTPTNIKTGYAEWLQFAKDLNLEAAVLYPTAGLAVGRIVSADWANAVSRAYNSWLYEEYLTQYSIFQGLAVLPMQRPSAAAAELRRAVTELGMVGGVLPATGLRGYAGDVEYWPVYEAANDLGCSLSIHGGLHQDLGMNQMAHFGTVHALGHPFGIMINFASLVVNGVFERFPNIRFGFMESGVAWVNFVLERLGPSSESFQPWDLADQPFQLTGKALTNYIIDLFRSGRAYAGVEGDESGLVEAIRTIGAQALVFSSDFPHEVDAESCRNEVEELLENEQVTEEDKHAILYENARKLYGLSVPAHAG